MVIHIHRAGYFSLSRASYDDVNQSVTCNAMQVMLREKCCIECDPEARDIGMRGIMVPAPVFVLREVSNIIKSSLTKASLGTATVCSPKVLAAQRSQTGISIGSPRHDKIQPLKRQTTMNVTGMLPRNMC